MTKQDDQGIDQLAGAALRDILKLRADLARAEQQLTTLREALKEMEAKWRREAADERSGYGGMFRPRVLSVAEESDLSRLIECADELSALLSEGGQ